MGDIERKTILPDLEEAREVCPILPDGDTMVVVGLEEETTTTSGLHIPESAKDKPQLGMVVAVGPGRFSEEMASGLFAHGMNAQKARVPMTYEPGDVVLFGKYNVTEIEVEGEEWLILRQVNALGKVKL